MSTNDVATRIPESEAMCEDFRLIDDLRGGTAAMRKAGELYMPKRALEEKEDYDARLGTATLFPAFTETSKTLTGRAFAEPMQISDDVLPWIREEVLDDVDRQGRKLATWARDVFRDGLDYGLVHILVDSPQLPPPTETDAKPIRTRADERSAKIRPYFVAIHPRRVLGWQADENGELVQVRILFWRAVPGEFVTTYVQQVRVYEPGRVRVFEAAGDKSATWELVSDIPIAVKRIPIATFYTNRTGLMQARPPLLELAHLNAKHWSMQASNDALIETASVPILASVGVDPSETIVIGAKSAIALPIDGDLKFVEHTGKAIDSGRMALQDLKDDMREAGAKLVKRTGETGAQTKTATEAGEDSARENSQLGDMVQSFQDTIADVLDITAEWRGATDGGSVKLSPNLDPDPPADSMAVLQAMNIRGALSSERLFDEAKRRGIIDEEATWEEEIERIKNDPLAVLPSENVTSPPAQVAA
jgi:hypothetical protein